MKAETNVPMGDRPDNPPDTILEKIGEALIAAAFRQPIPPLPSAAEIDARIERKLYEWDLEQLARRLQS